MAKPVRKTSGHTGQFNGSVGEGAKRVPCKAPGSLAAVKPEVAAAKPNFDPSPEEISQREALISKGLDAVSNGGSHRVDAHWSVCDSKGKITHVVAVVEDPWQESPRDLCDYDTTFVMTHGRYSMPNECDMDFDQYSSWAGVEAGVAKMFGDDFDIVPVSGTDHGRMSLNVGGPVDRWDSGRVGFIVVPKMPGVDSENVAREELASYQRYMDGELRTVAVYDASSDSVESCTDLHGVVDVSRPDSVRAFVASSMGSSYFDVDSGWHRR